MIPIPKTRFFAGLFSLVFCAHLLAAKAPDLPTGYSLQYQQSFKSKKALADFMMTDPSAWALAKSDGNTVLALLGASDYSPPHRSPLNIALIKGKTFGSFVLEVDIQQTGVKGTPINEYMKQYENAADAPGYAHRDFCFFFGFEDPSHFMYIHIAKAGDNNAHNVFVVNEAPRTPITDFRTLGADWGVEEWRKIRIVRDIVKGTVALYFDDMLTPIMIADDVPFEKGFIGFGSFDDIGYVDNIKIWAPESSARKQTFFK
ncbi:MAG: hypothetical protein O7C75_08385 [Verrucomicrobia bacterium]|nr:hypothetical protein [Verrucomicrobiota bacterium]